MLDIQFFILSMIKYFIIYTILYKKSEMPLFDDGKKSQ